MAKQKNKIDTDLEMDDLGLDFDIDMDDWGDDSIGRNKKPIRRLASNFARGAKASFQNPEHVKRAAAGVLPDGYGTALNTGFEVYELGTNLYNSAAEELRPAMPVIRSAVGRITSKTQRFLPKRVVDRLKEFSEGDDYQANVQYDADAEAITAGMAEVFGVQMEEQAREREEDRVRADIRARVQDKRTMQSIAVQNAMLKHMDRQTTFQDSVFSRALKKSLELQYRQTFYQRDILNLLMTGERRQQQQLAAIMHNTSLPDYRKMDLADAARHSFRDNLLNSVQQSAVQYVSDFSRNIGERFTGSVRNTAAALSMALNAGSDASGELREEIERSGGGASGFAAKTLGEHALPLLTLMFGRRIRRQFDKRPEWRERGSRLDYMFGNIPEALNEFAQSPDDDSSIRGGFMRFLKDMLPRMGIDSSLASSPMNEAMEATAFDKQTRRSIVEIIPGFLSRIHHELAIIRTKDSTIGRIDYNLHRGEFTDVTTVMSDTRKRVMHPYAMETGRRRIEEFVDRLDPDGQLSDRAREELRRQVLNDAISGRRFSPKRYMDPESHDAAELSMETREELSQIARGRFYDESGKERWSAINETAQQFSSLKHDIPDPAGVMRAIAQAGGREYLSALGLVSRHGFSTRIDYDAFHDQLLKKGTENPNLDEYNQDMGVETDAQGRPIINRRDLAKARRWARSKFRSAKDRVRGARDSVSQKFEELKSIRTRDGNRAVFDHVVLESRGYFDQQSGRVIESIDDIRGAVVDRYGVVVADAETIRDTWMSDHPQAAQKLRSVTGRLNTLRRKMRAAYRRGVGRTVRKQGEALWRATAEDLDELMQIRSSQGNRAAFDEVRLRAGEYIDQASGQVIRRVEDIRGDIVDQAGEVQFTAETIANDWLAEHPQTARKLKSARARARVFFRKAKRQGRKAWQGVQGSRMYGQVAGLYGSAQSKFRDVADHIQSEREKIARKIAEHPDMSRIDVAKLVAGEYYDETLKRHVTSIDEVRGRLVDRAGNVVLDLKARWDRARDYMGETLRRGTEHATQAFTSTQRTQTSLDGMGILVEQGDRQVMLLEQILRILESVEAGQYGSGSPEGGGEPGRRRRGWLDQNLRGLGRGLGRGLKGLASRYGRFAMGVWRAPFQAAGALRRGLGRVMSAGQDYLGDIHVAGGRVVLTRAKMNNGDYQDLTTQSPVRQFSDIRGAVVDTTMDPPLTVLTQEEFQQGLYDSNGRRLGRRLMGLLGAVGGAVDKIARGYLSMISAPFQAVTWAARKFRSANAPRDVYVKRDMSSPAVSVSHMRSGVVFQADRKTPVRSINDIFASGGGVFRIVDGELTEVISLDDIRAGLVDFRGKPIRPTGPGLIGMAQSAATGLVGGYIKTMGAVLGLGRDAIVGTARRLGNWLNPRNRSMSSDDATVVLLQQIYGLLDERLKKPVRIRKGSWEEQYANRMVDQDDDGSSDDGDGNDLRSLGLIGALRNLFGGGDDDDGDGGGSTIIGGFGGGAASNNRYDSRGRKRGGIGRNTAARRRKFGRKLGRSRIGRMLGLGKIGSMLGGRRTGMGGMTKRPGLWSRLSKGRLGSPLTMAATMLGGGYLIDRLGGEDSKLGGAASTAMNVAGVASLASMIPGVSGAMGAVGSGLGALAAGAAGLISAPVVLGAAAVAAAGYGLYRGFKKYKFGTYLPLRAYRMAQYGIDWKETSQVEKVVELEQMLEEHVRVDGVQSYIKTDGAIETEDLHRLFGVNAGWFSSNEGEQQKFNVWFAARFKPVYLKWVTSLRSIKSNVRLNDADADLSKDEKLNLLRAANGAPSSAYAIQHGPFDGRDLSIMGDAVQDAYKTALLEVDKDNTGTGIGSRMVSALRTAGTTGVLGIGGVMSAKMLDRADAQRREQGLENEQERINRLMGVGATATVAAGATIAATVNLPSTATTGRVRALQAIRLRAYGLRELVAERVATLTRMERELIESHIVLQRSTAKLSISAEEAVERYGPLFGLNMADERQRKSWKNWFENRFAVALLSFVSAAMQVDRSVPALQIDMRQSAVNLIKIAQAIISAYTRVMLLPVSIWTFTQSPWAEDQGELVLNNDSSSTNESLEALRTRKQEEQVSEEKAKTKTRGFMTAPFKDVQEKKDQGWSAVMAPYKDAKARADQGRSVTHQFGQVPSYTSAASMGAGDLRIAANSSMEWDGADQALAPTGLENVPYSTPVRLSGDAKEREQALLQTAMENGITDPMELAMFLAHTAHESARFTTTEEDIRWRPETMRRLWPNRFPSLELARAVHRQGYPAVAEKVYGNRMGNDQVGDGFKFRGRGFMQLTGKDNYRAFQRTFGKQYGLDVVSNPDVVAKDPKVAAMSAVHWWLNRGQTLRKLAQQGNVEETTRLVNGGLNGLSDRRQLFASYKSNIQDLMASIQTGTASYTGSGGSLDSVVRGAGGYGDMLNSMASNRTDTSSSTPTTRPGYGVLNRTAMASTSGYVPEQTRTPSYSTTSSSQEDRQYEQAMREQERVSRTVDTQSRTQRRVEDQRTKVMEDLQREQLVHLKSIDVQMGQVVTVLQDISARDIELARGRSTASRTSSPMRSAQTDNLSDTPRVSVRRNVAARA